MGLVIKILVLVVVIAVLRALILTAVYYGRELRERSLDVSAYRADLRQRIHVACRTDGQRDRSWPWRFKMYLAVSHNQMLFSRKPLDSFYPDLSFTDPEATDPNSK